MIEMCVDPDTTTLRGSMSLWQTPRLCMVDR